MISNHIGKASSIAEKYIVTESMIDRTKNQFLGQTSRPWILRKPWYRKSSFTNYSQHVNKSVSLAGDGSWRRGGGNQEDGIFSSAFLRIHDLNHPSNSVGN